MAEAKGIRAGKAFVELFADDSRLVRGLKAAQAKLKAFGAAVTGMGLKMMGLGAAMLAPLAGVAKSFADMGSKLWDMSKRTGVSVEALSVLGYAAEQSGADMESLETGLRKMQKAISAAAEGSSSAQEALAGLGLTVSDLAGLAPEKQFRLLADRLDKVADPTAKAAAAMEVFGKSGTALLPMIEGGAASLDTYQAKAERLGIVMSTQDAAAADAFGDTLADLWKVLRYSAATIGSTLAPVLQSLAVRLTSTVAATAQWLKANSGLVVGVLKVAAAVTAGGLALAGFGQAIGVLSGILKGVSVIIGLVASPVALVVGGLAAIAAALAYTGLEGQTFAEKMAGLGKTIMPAVQAATDFIKSAWQSVWKFLSPILAATVEGITSAWDSVVQYVTPIVAAFTEFIQTAFDALWQALQPLVEGARDLIVSAWASISPYVGPVLNWLQEAVITAFAALTFAITHWKALLEYSLVAAAYGIVRFANQAEHFLTVAIPGYLAWFADNWRDVFATIWNGVKTFAGNVWKNLVNLWHAVAGLFKGEGWSFQWTGLLEGFQSAIKELPKIAERQIGPLETSLGEHMRQLGEQIASDWEKTRAEFFTKDAGAPSASEKPQAGAPAVEQAASAIKTASMTLDDVADRVSGISVVGTFSSEALAGLGAGGGPMERTAKATEAVAKNTDKLVAATRSGRLVFT
jgi:hypothetical protein